MSWFTLVGTKSCYIETTMPNPSFLPLKFVSETTYQIPSFRIWTTTTNPTTTYSIISEGLTSQSRSQILSKWIDTIEINTKLRAIPKSFHSTIYRRFAPISITGIVHVNGQLTSCVNVPSMLSDTIVTAPVSCVVTTFASTTLII